MTCADDVVIAMFADITVSGFITVPDIIVGNADPAAMLNGAMAKSKYVNVLYSSVRKLTLKFPKSKYDRATMTIDTPFVAAVPPENRCRPSPGTIVTGS